MYKVLAIDLDGTLLADDKSVPQSNIEAFLRAGEAGLSTAICTGRALQGLKAILGDIGADRMGRYHVGLNGGLLYDGYEDKIVADFPMKKEWAEAAIALGRQLKERVNVQLYTKDQILVEERRYSTEAYERINRSQIDLVPDLMEYADRAVKIIFSLDAADQLKEQDELNKVAEEVRPLLPRGMTCYGSCEYLMEVLPETLHKGTGVQNLAKFMRLDTAEVAAIGDNDNDVPMLLEAGLAIAVANGVNHAKKVSDHITKRTNNEGAVAEAIDYIILKKNV